MTIKAPESKSTITGVGVYIVTGLLVAIFLVPVWRTLTFDNEGMWSVVFSTITAARAIFDGTYAFWTSALAFGAPQPFSQHLIYHPLMPLFALLPAPFVLGLVYYVGLLAGCWGVLGLGRKLHLHPMAAMAAGITYLLAAPTLNYTYTDFWPECLFAWNLLPLLFLTLINLLEARSRRQNLLWALLLALLLSLMFLNGHLGVTPLYAFALLFFLVGQWRKAKEKLPWILLVVGLTAVISFSKVVDLYGEYLRFMNQGWVERAGSSTGSISLYSLIVGPLEWFWQKGKSLPSTRILYWGAPFTLLSVAALGIRRLAFPYRTCFVVTALLSLAGMFIPPNYNLKVISWYFILRDPLILSTTLLGAMVVSRMLFSAKAEWRSWGYVVLALQVAVLAASALPYWFTFWSYDRFENKASQIKVFQSTPLIRELQRLQKAHPGRIFLSSRLCVPVKWGVYHDQGLGINTLFYHNLRMVNAYLKGVSYQEFYPERAMMSGQIFDEPTAPRNPAMLSVLNIRYFLAYEREQPPPGFVLDKSFALYKGRRLCLYRNPFAWPYAFVVSEPVPWGLKLPRMPKARHNRLMAADFSPALGMRQPGDPVTITRYRFGGIDLELKPSSSSRVVMISECFRKQWRAWGYDGQGRETALTLRPILEDFIAVVVPEGITRVSLRYRPWIRMVFTAVSWLGVLLLAGFSCYLGLSRRRGRGRTSNPLTG